MKHVRAWVVVWAVLGVAWLASDFGVGAQEKQPRSASTSSPAEPESLSLVNVKSYLRNGGKINELCLERGSWLHEVCYQGDMDAVEHLLNQGAEVDLRNNNNETPLHYACSTGQLKIAAALLSRGADANLYSKGGMTPLHNGIVSGKKDVVELLLSKGANIRLSTRQESDSRSCLELAIWDDPSDIATLLIKKGCPIDGELLIQAVRNGNATIVDLLLASGARADFRTKEKVTALHFAAYGSKFEQPNLTIIKNLLKHGAEVNARDAEGKTPLLIACASGQAELMKILLAAGAKVNAVDNSGNTPLHFATQSAALAEIESLIRHGADINTSNVDDLAPLDLAVKAADVNKIKLYLSKGAMSGNRDRKTPLHVAAESDNPLLLELFVTESKFPIDARDRQRCVPLHYAAQKGSINSIKALVAHKAIVDARDRDGQTPFHYAVKAGEMDAAKLLAELGADVKAVDKADQTALHLAAGMANVELVRFLADKGVDVNARNRDDRTPLHEALDGLHQRKTPEVSGELVAFLISRGADVNAQDCENVTPLHLAAKWGSDQVATLLIKKGAKIEARDKRKQTPLHWAQDLACLQLLINSGADIHAVDFGNSTPLHRTIEQRFQAGAELLLKQGAKLDAVDSKGNTPLHLAACMGEDGILKELLQRGVSVDARNNKGQTPLHLAAQMGNLHCAMFLVEAGADVNARGAASTSFFFNDVETFSKCTPLCNALVVPAGFIEEVDSYSLARRSHWQAAMVRLLVGKGARPDMVAVPTDRASTPLHMAACLTNSDLMEILLSVKCDVDVRNSRGETPLHLAISHGTNAVAELLIAKGANVHAKDCAEDTPVFLAIKCRKWRLAKLMSPGLTMPCLPEDENGAKEPVSFDGSSQNLKTTAVLATLDSPIPQGQNAVWCASFLSAWKALQNDLAGQDVTLAGMPDMVKSLNAAEDPRPMIPEESILAVAGWGDKGIGEKIVSGLKQKFPNKQPPNLDGLPPWSFVAYCYLEASVKFPAPYFQNDDLMAFTDSSGRKSKVNSFGIRSINGFCRPVREQVNVLFAIRSDESAPMEFAIDLCRTSKPSQIVVARVKRAATLAETLARVEKNIADAAAQRKKNAQPLERGLDEYDVLLVPDLSWKISHSFEVLLGKEFTNPKFKNYRLFMARQDTRFKLCRSGAELASEAIVGGLLGEPERTDYLLDRPFLIYMKKRGASMPYFVMWVDNSELLQSWGLLDQAASRPADSAASQPAP